MALLIVLLVPTAAESEAVASDDDPGPWAPRPSKTKFFPLHKEDVGTDADGFAKVLLVAAPAALLSPSP